MLKIKLKKFDIESGKILKNQDYATIVAAKSLVSVAEEEKAEILKSANVERDKILEKAKQEADKILSDAKEVYESEKKRGYTDGVASGRTEMADQLMALATKNADSLSRLEKDVTDVVVRAVKKIIGDIDKTELITDVVKNSLKLIKSQKQAVLKVAPSEASFLREKVDELIKDTPNLEFLDIISDAHLSPGACILETDLGVIDASVDVQIAAIEKSIGRGTKE